jgi:hypothetical protein
LVIFSISVDYANKFCFDKKFIEIVFLSEDIEPN